MNRKPLIKLDAADYSGTVQALIRNNDGSAVVTRTAYSVTVETETSRYLLASGGMPGVAFGVARRLRAEAVERAKPDGLGGTLWGTLPGAGRETPKYYRFTSGKLPAEAVCVDITAAYPSTLEIGGVVTPEAVQRVMSLPKQHRLKVVGMLATRRHVTEYRRGKAVSEQASEEPTAGAFFALCRAVGDLMDFASTEAGADFLLYWVDGAFVRRDAATAFAAILEDHGYITHTSDISDIARSSKGNYIRYRKDGELTYLCVPSRKTVKIADINDH